MNSVHYTCEVDKKKPLYQYYTIKEMAFKDITSTIETYFRLSLAPIPPLTLPLSETQLHALSWLSTWQNCTLYLGILGYKCKMRAHAVKC